METKQIEELVAKYNEGLADPSEVKLIEQLIESGAIELTQLRELDLLNQEVFTLEVPSPSIRLDDQFYSLLTKEKKKLVNERFLFSMPNWNVLFPRLAVASIVLIAGFAGGYFFNRPSQNQEVHILTQQVSDLREMMVFSLLEKESATDRLLDGACSHPKSAG